MSSQALRAVTRADVHGCARASSIQRQLDRFRPEIRPAMAALARRHVRLAELSLSFPALLVALARPRARFDPAPVVDGVIAGLPLAVLCQRADVPLWLRHMPPQMLPGPLPRLPDSGAVRQRIVNHFPRHAKYAARWFDAVSRGALQVNEEFALWCAREFAGRLPFRQRRLRNLLCLWAWFSQHPGTRGHALIQTPWTPDIRIKAGFNAAWAWHDLLELEFHLGEKSVEDLWLQPGVADGYEFLPIRNAREIEEEAAAMQNCLRSYGGDVAGGYSRLWSMRRDGERIATLEIGHWDDHLMPHIRQLCLQANAVPPAPLWIAAWRWVVNQDLKHFPASGRAPSILSLQAKSWRTMWKPYWMAMGRVPSWLPLGPSRDALSDL